MEAHNATITVVMKTLFAIGAVSLLALHTAHWKSEPTCTNGYSMVVHLLPKPPIGHSPISGKAIQHPAAPIHNGIASLMCAHLAECVAGVADGTSGTSLGHMYQARVSLKV